MLLGMCCGTYQKHEEQIENMIGSHGEFDDNAKWMKDNEKINCEHLVHMQSFSLVACKFSSLKCLSPFLA